TSAFEHLDSTQAFVDSRNGCWPSFPPFLTLRFVMSLLDHFHPPLSKRRHWQNLHSAWANALRDLLNGGLLPPRYVAEVNISLASQVEVDLGTFEEHAGDGGSGAAGSLALWAPPATFRSVVLDATVQDT